MYPFNRATSVTVEEKEPEMRQRHENGTGKLVARSIMSNILDLGGIEDEWIGELVDGEDELDNFKCTWRGVTCVSRCLRPVLVFLRCIALFPRLKEKKRTRKRDCSRFIMYIFLLNISMAAVALNGYLTSLNMWLISAYRAKFGLMHASTVSCIITSVKPLINIFIISLFALRIKQHVKLIKTLDTVDVCFRSAFHLAPPLRAYKIALFVLVIISFFVPFTFRIVEFIVTQQKIGRVSLIHDLGFVIVPLLTLWNVVPLLYYDLYNRIVRFYCYTLMKSLGKEHRKRHFSLKFYYEQFLRITNVQEAVGSLFNPFVLFSLAWSMLVLCLAIYFMTQPHSSLWQPINAEQVANETIRILLTKNVRCTIIWACWQVFVAVTHIAVICANGMYTNEQTRQIVNAVLRIVPDASADLDRFQISCFVHKMSTQFMWGMSVWRAFPLERTTFFTLVSVIVTYSLLLLKLKDNNPAMVHSDFVMDFNLNCTAAGFRPPL